MATLDIHVPARAMSARQVEHWIWRAKPGQFMQYHQGLLHIDRSPMPGASEQEMAACDRLHRIARLLWRACEDGAVRLFSIRLDEGFYSYLVQRTSVPVRMEVLA